MPSARPGRRWCSSRRKRRSVRSSARSRTATSSSPLQSATRVKLLPLRLSERAAMPPGCYSAGERLFEACLREQLAEAREPGEHPALDRAQWLIEALCELRLSETAVVAELEGFALLRRQLP